MGGRAGGRLQRRLLALGDNLLVSDDGRYQRAVSSAAAVDYCTCIQRTHAILAEDGANGVTGGSHQTRKDNQRRW